MVPAPRQRTRRSRSGDAAERFAARLLADQGWTIIGAKVRVGQDELDLVAVEPGGPEQLVFVEVRSNVTNRFGAPEESVVGGKLRRTYRAAWALLRLGMLPDGTSLPKLPWRVDVLIVERGPKLARDVGGPTVRHLRRVSPE